MTYLLEGRRDGESFFPSHSAFRQKEEAGLDCSSGWAVLAVLNRKLLEGNVCTSPSLATPRCSCYTRPKGASRMETPRVHGLASEVQVCLSYDG